MASGDGDGDDDERRLVERARVDAEAFAELYRHWLPRVHAFAWRRTGSVDVAEDICSATFESVVTNLDRFEWRPGGFAPWLFRIAANHTVSHHRREGRSDTAKGQRAMARLVPSGPLDPAEAVAQRAGGNDIAELRAALDRLNPRYQRAIALRHLAGLDTEGAAAAMGLARPAFAVVLSRALRALRRELQPGRNGQTSSDRREHQGERHG